MTNVRHSLAGGAFRQDWSDASLIQANNDWSRIASVIGYLGDDASTTATGVNPTNLTSATIGTTVNVTANSTSLNPSGGGVYEVSGAGIANPTIALNGSGTADFPHVVFYLDSTGQQNVRFQASIRDLDSTDNAVQQVAVQFRVAGGPWQNISGGYIADATDVGATKVTAIDLVLPDAANNAADLEIRVLTTNAPGNDELVGVDDIVVTSSAVTADTTPPMLASFNPTDPDDGAVAVDPGANIVLRFTEAVVAGSGSFTLSNGDSDIRVFDIANPQVSISGNTVTIDPATDLLGGTVYHLTASAGIVKDAAGNQFAGIGGGELDFTTQGLLTLKIGEIQGLGHTSAYAGALVRTQGVVTAIDSNGFYLQSAAGQTDGDARTSDAVLVFTGSAPAGVAVGELIQVDGTVAEFRAANDARNLTITEITSPSIAHLGMGNIEHVVIGAGHLLPPTAVIEDDKFATYDPASDGIDFYESLEGMLVTVDAPQVVSNTNDFGETWVVASGGAGTTGISARGGITIADGDYNPERIQLDDDNGLFTGFHPDYSIGDRLSDVQGIVSYGFQSYELLVTQPVTVTEDVALWKETTTLIESDTELSVATYNMENFSASDSADKIYSLASDILFNLNAPDIIAAQEIQDANGATAGGSLSGEPTAQALIQAILDFGGPQYAYAEIAPTANNATGGEPNGNIRNGYFYDPSRVHLVDGSLQLIEDPVFNGTRRPLAATFEFNGDRLTLVNVHSTSRLGSDALYGATQPPADAGDSARTAQMQAVRTWIDGHVSADPSGKFAVLGDFNGFSFEGGVKALTNGGLMQDLNTKLPSEERYSYIFDGNLQQIDHIVATNNLYQVAQFQPVHLNAEQLAADQISTDHDPLLAIFQLGAPQPAFEYYEQPHQAFRLMLTGEQWFAIA